MKYGVYFFTSLCIVLCFGDCTLEGAPIIGPAGGYVFYDKGSYSSGWRYLEFSPVDVEEFEKNNASLYKANELCTNFYYGGYNDWRLPNDSELKSMLDMLPKKGGDKMYLSSDYTFYLWYAGKWCNNGSLPYPYSLPVIIRVVREF
jgi:hypothetical protein